MLCICVSNGPMDNECMHLATDIILRRVNVHPISMSVLMDVANL